MNQNLLPDNPTQFDVLHAIRAVVSRAGLDNPLARTIHDLADKGMFLRPDAETMADRFLSWPLPKDFRPDAGISFEPEFNVEYMASLGKPPMRHEPTGTNLLDADQAREMVRFILGENAKSAGTDASEKTL